jgi:CBS domain-containing protein
MKVSSVLLSKGSDVHTVLPQQSIRSVIKIFQEKGIGALVVSDNYVEVQGMISERDIILGFAEHGGNLLTMTVADVMRNGNVCSPDDDLELVMSRMTTRRVRHLAVSDDGLLCGIISIGDVVKKQLTDLELEANVLRDAYQASRVSALVVN